MLKAKLDSARKNKKGFSLIELIIVVAIMVALIAVLAPSYVKYVQKSRNSALANAAESLYTAIQTYYGDPDMSPKGGVKCKVSVPAAGPISVEWTTGDTTDQNAIKELAGVDTSKKMGKATVTYEIEATKSGETYVFSMTSATVA